MINFSEKIVLLSIDEISGNLLPLPEKSLDFAIAGAILLELSFAHKLDTDQNSICFVDNLPSQNNEIWNEALKLIAKTPNIPIKVALARLAIKSDFFKKKIFQNLLEKKILEKKEEKFLWIIKEKSYPTLNDKPIKEIRQHIRQIILDNNEIPSPDDVVIISLMYACELSSVLFSPSELKSSKAKIEKISKMDFVSQAIISEIKEIQHAMLEVLAYSGL